MNHYSVAWSVPGGLLLPGTGPRVKEIMMATSPTQLSTAALKQMKYTYQIVERWNQYARMRQDLFGCVDILAMLPGVGIVGIQATSGSNHAARLKKAMAEPRLRTWLKCGGRFEVWSWSKVRITGGTQLRWQLRRDEVRLSHLPAEPDDDNESSARANVAEPLFTNA